MYQVQSSSVTTLVPVVASTAFALLKDVLNENNSPDTAKRVTPASFFPLNICNPFLGLSASRELSREKHSLGEVRIEVYCLLGHTFLGVPLSPYRETPKYG